MISTAAKRRHPGRFRTCIFALLVFICLGLMCRADERKVQKRVAPVYPELARRMHVSGAVRILATVAPDGTVTDVKTLNGNKLLSPAAEEAVKKWKFVPGDSESTVPIEVNFDVSN
jgi:TonB family protein